MAWICRQFQLGCVPFVRLAISLVPFLSGHAFTASVSFLDQNYGTVQINCIELYECDSENADLLDLQPHGQASPQSKKTMHIFVLNLIHRMKHNGVPVMSVSLGHELTEFVPEIQGKLNEHQDIFGRVFVDVLSETQHGPITFVIRMKCKNTKIYGKLPVASMLKPFQSPMKIMNINCSLLLSVSLSL